MAAVSLSRTWCRYVAGNVRQRALTGIVERSCRETHTRHTLARSHANLLPALICRTLPSSINSPPIGDVCWFSSPLSVCPSSLPSTFSLRTRAVSPFLIGTNKYAGPFTGWGKNHKLFQVNAWANTLIDDSNKRFATTED